MKNLFLTILLISIAKVSLAQNDQITDEIIKDSTRILNVIKISNGKEINTTYLILGPNEMQNLEIVSRDEIKKNYSSSNPDIVFKITPKPNVKLINLQQILDKYHVQQQYRNYKILDENILVNDPGNLLASDDIIQYVIVNTNKQYINIISKNHANVVKARKEAKADHIKRLNEMKQH